MEKKNMEKEEQQKIEKKKLENMKNKNWRIRRKIRMEECVKKGRKKREILRKQIVP